MAAFDGSPRAAKRRKIAGEEPTPVYSRVLRTVKQAVYGKPSSPKLGGQSIDSDEKSQVEVVQRRREGKALKGGTKDTGSGNQYAAKVSDDEIGRAANAPPEVQNGRRNHSRLGIEHSNRGAIENSEQIVTPSKKRNRKYKGWAYVEDSDELAEKDVSADVVGLDNGVGRVKRGREDLTIDINPHQLKPRGSFNTSGEAKVGTNDAPTPATGGARRTSRRKEAKEGQTPILKPVARLDPLRKKGSSQMLHVSDGVYPDPDDHMAQEVDEDASPDELAQESPEEESDQDGLIQTSSRKAKRKDQRSKRTAPGEDLESVVDDLLPSTQKATNSHPHSSFNDHAQALQKMLEVDPEALQGLKAHILSGLTGRRRLPLINLEEEETKVKHLVEQTVLAGEGNSMLIIGSRGSGKTNLVESILSRLSTDHRDDFHVVRLNGFIHTDDKLALREIWRQLGREMDVENDELGSRGNYADTLTSLLALLAHPATEEDEAGTARSVVFILDEFDLFASHPRQTLLYNLFDVAQSRNAPIAVLGMTTKVNVVDSLEKRVKSRFGQRYVHLSLPKSFNAFQDICLAALNYQPSTRDLFQQHETNLKAFSTTWNDYIDTLFSNPLFQQFLQTLYTSTKSVSAFLNASLLPIATLTPTTLLTPSSFTSSTLQPPDSKLALIPSLSTLALCLLIAAARLDIILDTDVCTFGMAYEEYVALASKSKMQSSAAGQMAVGGVGGARVWGKEVAKGAWEGLGRLELILPAGAGGRAAGRGEMWKVDVGLVEIGGVLEGEGCRGGALGKWCREI